ncbi:levS [Lemmus lemmus]
MLMCGTVTLEQVLEGTTIQLSSVTLEQVLEGTTIQLSSVTLEPVLEGTTIQLSSVTLEQVLEGTTIQLSSVTLEQVLEGTTIQLSSVTLGPVLEDTTIQLSSVTVEPVLEGTTIQLSSVTLEPVLEGTTIQLSSVTLEQVLEGTTIQHSSVTLEPVLEGTTIQHSLVTLELVLEGTTIQHSSVTLELVLEGTTIQHSSVTLEPVLEGTTIQLSSVTLEPVLEGTTIQLSSVTLEPVLEGTTIQHSSVTLEPVLEGTTIQHSSGDFKKNRRDFPKISAWNLLGCNFIPTLSSHISKMLLCGTVTLQPVLEGTNIQLSSVTLEPVLEGTTIQHSSGDFKKNRRDFPKISAWNLLGCNFIPTLSSHISKMLLCGTVTLQPVLEGTNIQLSSVPWEPVMEGTPIQLSSGFFKKNRSDFAKISAMESLGLHLYPNNVKSYHLDAVLQHSDLGASLGWQDHPTFFSDLGASLGGQDHPNFFIDLGGNHGGHVNPLSSVTWDPVLERTTIQLSSDRILKDFLFFMPKRIESRRSSYSSCRKGQNPKGLLILHAEKDRILKVFLYFMQKRLDSCRTSYFSGRRGCWKTASAMQSIYRSLKLEELRIEFQSSYTSCRKGGFKKNRKDFVRISVWNLRTAPLSQDCQVIPPRCCFAALDPGSQSWRARPSNFLQGALRRTEGILFKSVYGFFELHLYPDTVKSYLLDAVLQHWTLGASLGEHDHPTFFSDLGGSWRARPFNFLRTLGASLGEHDHPTFFRGFKKNRRDIVHISVWNLWAASFSQQCHIIPPRCCFAALGALRRTEGILFKSVYGIFGLHLYPNTVKSYLLVAVLQHCTLGASLGEHDHPTFFRIESRMSYSLCRKVTSSYLSTNSKRETTLNALSEQIDSNITCLSFSYLGASLGGHDNPTFFRIES